MPISQHVVNSDRPRHEIAHSQNVARTMSSIDLRDIINGEREAAGESKVRNDQFIVRVQDELGEELGRCKKIAHPQTRVLMDSYDLTIDQCMLVGMRESKAVRRSVLQKLKDIEGPRVIATLPDFSNPAAAARAWAEQFELQQAANQALAIAAPKAEFVDKYVDSTGLKGFRQTAKLLGANEARFREFLLDRRIMYRMGGEWQAYQNHVDAGRFEVKTGTSEAGHAFNQAKFTPKGVNWIAGLWAQYKLESA
ncbi:phage antirepressor KilAC domain-containing protein [Pseudomonas cannabina]|uniref:Phage antirepressor KilAC domain-containing protein n=2 Tax=Pseudomonas cannabina TaxID=86840 RepID=A0ABS1XFB3_PSEC1|nr:phage antirepressor KilAC domain-containing protein [Pseudomonas cannabina]MBM0140177.1 phage antirepressor KilAC domain-containing protein [Pseudomonas cannabina pv. alisalensis]RMN77513.1 putative phage regulatory protein [Pseudomonas cannabina pv. alisalensis]